MARLGAKRQVVQAVRAEPFVSPQAQRQLAVAYAQVHGLVWDTAPGASCTLSLQLELYMVVDPLTDKTLATKLAEALRRHRQMLTDVFTMFSTTNPLHADAWPSIRQMEAEVVAMTASMLGGGPSSTVCGSMTSGGTESILLAMKASRDWAAAKRGVRQPEIIIARSAHAAYFKAAEYFAMKLVVVQPGKDLRLSGSTVRRALTRNTAVVVASAPCFPHGVVDAVEDIA
ncbi:uncharacterized protein HaLaN_02692, partial [Haematococcus lacustris]